MHRQGFGAGLGGQVRLIKYGSIYKFTGSSTDASLCTFQLYFMNSSRMG